MRQTRFTITIDAPIGENPQHVDDSRKLIRQVEPRPGTPRMINWLSGLIPILASRRVWIITGEADHLAPGTVLELNLCDLDPDQIQRLPFHGDQVTICSVDYPNGLDDWTVTSVDPIDETFELIYLQPRIPQQRRRRRNHL